MVTTASGVFANFGGVPLAFIFIATIGTTGLATGWLNDIGINLSDDFGFDLFGFSGVTMAYFYFQVPLMVLVITPALEGLKPAWREAADNLGARQLAVLAARRRPGAVPVVPRRRAAAVRQRRSRRTPPPRH